MTLIDDYSRRVWIYTLKSKGNAMDKFKQWLNLTENQIGKKLKKLRHTMVLSIVQLNSRSSVKPKVLLSIIHFPTLLSRMDLLRG